jgi:CRP/FNR family transcriptional regulator, nitrogen fixation regulation protein
MRSTRDNLVRLFGPEGSPSRSRQVAIIKGQKIFGEGQSADHFYRVVTGVVRTYTILDDGRRQIAGFYLPGDFFGLETGARYRLSASGLCDVTIAAFRRADLDALLASDPAFRAQVLSSLMSGVERAQGQVLMMGRKTAREEIADFLLDFAHRASKSKSSDLPMRRSDIADFLGLSRETVCRTLAQLACDGIDDVNGHEPSDR